MTEENDKPCAHEAACGQVCSCDEQITIEHEVIVDCDDFEQFDHESFWYCTCGKTEGGFIDFFQACNSGYRHELGLDR